MRGTLGLVAVAAALAAGTLATGRALLPERPLPTPTTPPLLDVAPERVARLEWERGGERLTLVHTASGWFDASGHSWPGDAVSVALDALASIHPRVVAMGDGDLAEFGLAPAAERLRVLDDTGTELLAMDIGNRNPAWTGSYARHAGRQEVLLVGALLRWELDKLRSAREPSVQP